MKEQYTENMIIFYGACVMNTGYTSLQTHSEYVEYNPFPRQK
jgi:hypothetical protein